MSTNASKQASKVGFLCTSSIKSKLFYLFFFYFRFNKQVGINHFYMDRRIGLDYISDLMNNFISTQSMTAHLFFFQMHLHMLRFHVETININILHKLILSGCKMFTKMYPRI